MKAREFRFGVLGCHRTSPHVQITFPLNYLYRRSADDDCYAHLVAKHLMLIDSLCVEVSLHNVTLHRSHVVKIDNSLNLHQILDCNIPKFK